MWKIWTLALVIGAPALAEVRRQVPGLTVVAVGALCPPSLAASAPAPMVGKGRIGIVLAPFAVALAGDSFPARRDLGIGFVIALPAPMAAQRLTGQVWREGGASVDHWELGALKDGIVAVGLTPDKGESLAPGRYSLGVYGPGEALFVYRFTILAAEPAPGGARAETRECGLPLA